MNKLLSILLAVVLLVVLHTQFVELAYKLGFAELKMVAVLQNQEKMKVKCDAYALGFFDEIKIQNNFQKCINDYEAQGYNLITRLDS